MMSLSVHERAVEKLTLITTVDSAEVMRCFHEAVLKLAASGLRIELIVAGDTAAMAKLDSCHFSPEAGVDIRPLIVPSGTGQFAAILAGMRQVSGDVVLTIDPDMANNLGDLERFLACYRRGADVVYGWRQKRNDVSWPRIFLSRIFSLLVLAVSKPRVHDINTPMVMLSRPALEHLLAHPAGIGDLKLYMPFAFSGSFAEVPIAVDCPVLKNSNYGAGDMAGLFFSQLLGVLVFFFSVRMRGNGD